MGKKLKNVMLHMMVSATAVSLLFGSTMCVFAEDTEADVQIAEMNDAEMTPNSEKLVSRKAPKEAVSYTHLDVYKRQVSVRR